MTKKIALLENSQVQFKIFFFVGVDANTPSDYYNDLMSESTSMNDILQIDVIDQPLNITQKLFSVFEWISFFCPKIDYFLKTDEEVFINLEKFADGLRMVEEEFEREFKWSVNSGKQMMVLGFREENSLVKRKKEPESVPLDIYPYEKFEFPYLRGCAALSTLAFVRNAYALGVCLRALFIDDVYIFGYLPLLLGAYVRPYKSLNFSRPVLENQKPFKWLIS